jgi:16S rRNA (adenine1518-N6/adenine1519-N6)-dimethyltransferase
MGKRLGQHFLRDPRILDRIVDALHPASDETVLEIGAGEGTLTRRLARRVGHVVAVEKDRRLAELLGGVASGERVPPMPDNVKVLQADALRLDWHRSVPLPTPHSRFKVAGNIPYRITSPLIAKALIPPAPSLIVFLVQQEVAGRLGAAPGTKTYGAMTVGVQAVALVERLFVVRAGAFAPPPRVDSAVVRLTPRADPVVSPDEEQAFRAFVTGLFSRRRKQLQRGLRDVLSVSPTRAAAVLEDAGVDPTARPETLDPETFGRLFRTTLR